MLILSESAAGYAVFKVKDGFKFKTVENVEEYFNNPSNDTTSPFELLVHKRFENLEAAVRASAETANNKSNDILVSTINEAIQDNMKKQTLVVSNTNIGNLIKEALGEEKLSQIKFKSGDFALELLRGINSNAAKLLGDVTDEDLKALRCGLAHNVSRYKIKFSPDKVDTMIVHAVSLLDEVDKELNNYVMRLREWYGWHFPEMTKIVTDPVAYCNVIMKCSMRQNIKKENLEEILPADVEEKLKQAAETSMGTEISEEDVVNIKSLAYQVIEFTDYRAHLQSYLSQRMTAIAPATTMLLGDLVGARLIAHSGSLVSLAKAPASTIQILGAEKALFRALKTKKNTPKYGLVYHAAFVSQASAKNKGKISRKLANKAAIAIRSDALAEEEQAHVGIELMDKMQKQFNNLEGKSAVTNAVKQAAKTEKYENESKVVKYEAKDSTMPAAENVKVEVKEEPNADDVQTPSKKEKKKKKKRKSELDVTVKSEAEEVTETPKSEKKKKKKKKLIEEIEEAEVKVETETPKKKKKRKVEESAENGDAAAEPEKKKKKKKKKSISAAEE